MSPGVGDSIYRVRKNLIEGGLIELWSIERRTVESVTASVVVAGELACCEFPSHTVPDPLIFSTPEDGSIMLSVGDVGAGRLWDIALPTLPESEVLNDAQVEADYLGWANRKHVSRELGRPQPIITDEQLRVFLIYEYRKGLLAF